MGRPEPGDEPGDGCPGDVSYGVVPADFSLRQLRDCVIDASLADVDGAVEFHFSGEPVCEDHELHDGAAGYDYPGRHGDVAMRVGQVLTLRYDPYAAPGGRVEYARPSGPPGVACSSKRTILSHGISTWRPVLDGGTTEYPRGAPRRPAAPRGAAATRP